MEINTTESTPEPVYESRKIKSHWEPRLVLAIMVLGLGLRLCYVQLIDTPPFSDMADYETIALNLLDGKGLCHGFYKAYRPPLFPLMIAGIYKLGGPNPDLIRYVQCILSILTIPLLYLMVFWLLAPSPVEKMQEGYPVAEGERRESLARKVAAVTAILFCLEETSVFFCGQELSETLYVFLVLAWGAVLVRMVKNPNLGHASMAGILGGMAILTRPIFLLVFLFSVLWSLYAGRKFFPPPPSEWKQFHLLDSPYAPPFLMMLYAATLVSVCTVRNYAVTGAFVPVSTNTGVNFYLGHHEGFGYFSFGAKEDIRQSLRMMGSYDEVLESRVFLLKGLEYIRENPVQDMKNNLAKIYHLYLAPAEWQTAFMPWKWFSIHESPYKPWPWQMNQRNLRFWKVHNEQGEEVMPSYHGWFWQEGRLPLVHWGWPMIYLTLLGIGWAIYRREPIPFPLGYILFYTLTMMVFFADARFRFPLMPFLYFFAAYGIVNILTLLTRNEKKVL